MAQTVGAKLPDDLVEHLDKQARRYGVSRSAVIRAYLINVARNPDVLSAREVYVQDQKDAVERTKDEKRPKVPGYHPTINPDKPLSDTPRYNG
jgi:predicted transcriptional regulator